MSTLVVVGAQWGDEGKGKVVDVLAARAEIVARFAGGNNAGHTLVHEGSQLVTHLVPSGCRYPGTVCALGAGMVIDPEVLMDEVAQLRGHGLLMGGELRVSLGAHLVLPHHRDLDALREDQAADSGRGKIGTTRRGVGPAYEAKAGRRGVRVGDLFDDARLTERLEGSVSAANAEFERRGVAARVDLADQLETAKGWADWLESVACDVGALCDEAIGRGERVLFEGAQGAMLDLDHGTYPFVTSSSAVAGGVCTGIGIGPTAIDRVWGITKAYTTRVGAGPFPTRLSGPQGQSLRDAGAEYGATTGRPRDCGWLDLVALRYAVRVNGMAGLCVSKLDVLAQLPEAYVCVAYEDGLEPGRDDLERARPRLEPIPGWSSQLGAQLRAAATVEQIPGPVRAYLDRIAEATGVDIVLVSVGPERDQTIELAGPFDPVG